jgi:outer membrane lipoprotein carrier protein
MLVLTAPAFAGVLDEIRERQKGVRTVRADFRQEKHTELLDRPIRSSGVFYFKAPVGVRWEYRDAMTVIYDGKTLYLHYIGLDEAEKVEGAAGYVGPLCFDIDILLKDYDVKAAKQGGGALLDLSPNKRMPFQSMQMLFREGEGFPYEVRVLEASGDRTVIKFEKIEMNAPVSDELLRFEPPPGVVVRERML